MFDSVVVEEQELGVMSGDQLAAAIVENHAELLRRECRVLELACASADLHDRIGLGLECSPLVERACMFGGPGTPMVSEFCVTELGALQGTGPMAARALIAEGNTSATPSGRAGRARQRGSAQLDGLLAVAGQQPAELATGRLDEESAAVGQPDPRGETRSKAAAWDAAATIADPSRSCTRWRTGPARSDHCGRTADAPTGTASGNGGLIVQCSAIARAPAKEFSAGCGALTRR